MRTASWKAWIWIATLMLAGTEEARAAAAAVVLPRPGQVGIGVQGGYGALLESGNLGDTFTDGPTVSVRLRYRMRYERGFGLSFESQSFVARPGQVPQSTGGAPPAVAEDLSLILSGVEFYQLFGTRTRSVRMIMVGAGLAQARTKLSTGETELSGTTSGDGLYLSAGVGVERFFYRSLAWDLSGRYAAAFIDGNTNHDLQVALGLIFYASY